MNAPLLKVSDRMHQILGASAPMTAGLGQDLCRLRK